MRLFLTTTTALTLCLPAAAMAADGAEVTFTAPATYTISWTANGPVDVYVSADPQAGPDSATLISADDADGVHVFERSDTTSRPYFVLEEEMGEPVTTALRLLPLEGGRNFRDLGGYATQDGRTVRWGMLYRSGVMHQLTDADYDYLGDLGIRVVCDFRATSEREDEPTDWRAGEIDYIAWDYELDQSGIAAAFEGEVSAQRSVEAFKEFYRQAPYDFAERYAVMFKKLAAGETPLAFNCSAGKDRTGVAAALILSALGVPRETVAADYSLSDDYVDYMQTMREEGVDPDSDYAFLAQLPDEVVRPFLSSDPVFIQAALDQIEADHGSIEAYLNNVLGVTDAELEAMRANLLD
jgi:protein-tyrosine phosphatase